MSRGARSKGFGTCQQGCCHATYVLIASFDSKNKGYRRRKKNLGVFCNRVTASRFGNCKPKRAAFAQSAFHLDFAAVLFNELFAQNQAQAGAFFVRRSTGGVG